VSSVRVRDPAWYRPEEADELTGCGDDGDAGTFFRPEMRWIELVETVLRLPCVRDDVQSG
jgi:hypothetical protein